MIEGAGGYKIAASLQDLGSVQVTLQLASTPQGVIGYSQIMLS
jgi:hypothetical protein